VSSVAKKVYKMQTAYKVFIEKDNCPLFLFHGLSGSKIVTLDEWLAAEVKWAKEGSNPYYWTAFHVYPSIETISKWVHSIRKFADRFVVRVLIADTRPKPTAGHAVLAEKMMVTKENWLQRIKLTEYKY
jgi:hypothetical protein